MNASANTNTDDTQYTMLLDIAKEIGELRGDVKASKKEISGLSERVSEIDKIIVNKIAEAFDATQKRQDMIRDSLEAEIAFLRTDVNEAKKRIDTLDARVKKIEEIPKTRIFEIFEKFKGLLIAAILAALVGWCMSFMKDLTKAVRAPLPAAPAPQIQQME